MPSVTGTITFRPLEHGDLPMLQRWLTMPHVAEWWPGEPSLPEVEAEFAPMIADPAMVQPSVVLLDGRPVGYIQSYVAMGAGDGWWEDVTDPGRRGIDQFIADPSLLGQGLGRRMVRQFVEMLLDDPAVTSVQTDPDPRNDRAVRCYRAAGFVEVGEVETPDGRAVLLVKRKE